MDRVGVDVWFGAAGDGDLAALFFADLEIGRDIFYVDDSLLEQVEALVLIQTGDVRDVVFGNVGEVMPDEFAVELCVAVFGEVCDRRGLEKFECCFCLRERLGLFLDDEIGDVFDL